MRAVGIKTLKNKLSEYVKIASSGETVLVTDRDRVVAELGPPQPGRAERLEDAQLAQSIRGGVIKPRTHPAALPPRNPDSTLAEILADLDRSRQDRIDE